jgi:hypothetical protein
MRDRKNGEMMSVCKEILFSRPPDQDKRKSYQLTVAVLLCGVHTATEFIPDTGFPIVAFVVSALRKNRFPTLEPIHK